jgi:hypothetical protein
MWSMDAFRRFAALPGRDRVIYVEAAFLDAAFRCLLLVGSFSVARTVARALAGHGGADQPDMVIRAVEAASRFVPASNCLSEALTGWVLLTRANALPELRVGVIRAPRLEAHAWVETDGRVVIGGGADEAYHRLEGDDLMRA